jgi:hypothetical protein
MSFENSGKLHAAQYLDHDNNEDPYDFGMSLPHLCLI